MRSGADTRSTNPLDDLSKREEDILRLVAEGKSNKEGWVVFWNCREKTVKHYMTAILQKLHVRNRSGTRASGPGSSEKVNLIQTAGCLNEARPPREDALCHQRWLCAGLRHFHWDQSGNSRLAR